MMLNSITLMAQFWHSLKSQILAMPQKIAEECGVDRKTFQRIKQRIREKGDLNLNTPAVKRLYSKSY